MPILIHIAENLLVIWCNYKELNSTYLFALKIGYYPPFISNFHRCFQYSRVLSSLRAIMLLADSVFRNNDGFSQLFQFYILSPTYPSLSPASIAHFISHWYGSSLEQRSTPAYLPIFYSINCFITSYQGFTSWRKLFLRFASCDQIQFGLIIFRSFCHIEPH